MFFSKFAEVFACLRSTFIRFSFILIVFSIVNSRGQQADDSTDGQVTAPVDQINEFCQLETMRGRCRWKSEVIVMTSARWGRMKTGRCLNIHPNFLSMHGQDPLFLGCSEDVLSIADKKCSGRSECNIRIPDSDLDKVTPCYPDQKSYLETSYTCVKVVQESRSCLVGVVSDQQFISGSSLSSDQKVESACGSRSHPWRLEAPVGQRINISLLDFVGSSSSMPPEVGAECHQYGYVIDKSNKKNVSICATITGDRPHREKAVYISDSNSVEVFLIGGNYNFLVKINAVGCTNMIPPDNAWLKRNDNDIIIGCYLSQQMWQLKCDGHEWKGQVGECSESYNSAVDGSSAAIKSTDNFEYDNRGKLLMAMVVVAGGAVIVCFVVVTIGILCLQRCKRSYKSDVRHSMHGYQKEAKQYTLSSANGGPQMLLSQNVT